MIRISNALVAAAVSGILVGATGCASSPAPAANSGTPTMANASGANGMPAASIPKHACKGQNGCKGQGGCKVEGKNACKGQNDCKGQGGCKTDA